jgi:sugar (pentulose or hexulose) kinase
MRILALDVGTSAVKAAVLSVEDCAPAGAITRVDYALDHPTADAAEVPARRLWGAVAAAARDAARGCDGVEGIGLSCMTPALVVLDAAAQPVMPIWTHLDRRARPAARQVWAAVGEDFLQAIGNRPLPGGISALCWRQQLSDNPYLDRKARHYLHVNGWLALHLTGEPAFDPANACFSGLFDTMTERRWSGRWCDFFQVNPDWLPGVFSGDRTVGNLRASVAAELGVPAGVPVKLGTADTSCALLASALKPGELLHEVGTTQVLAALATKPLPGPRRLTRLLGVGDAYVHVTHNPVGGGALEWMHQLCFHEQSRQEFFSATVPNAALAKTRVTLDPPFLGGDRLEIEAHRAAFRDLTVGTDRLELLAGVLESMRRCHRQALIDLGVGERFRRIVLSGGAAEVVHGLLPGYREATVEMLEEGSLRGVAKLFQARN